MKKIFSILIALALVLSFSLVATTPVGADSGYRIVDDDGLAWIDINTGAHDCDATNMSVATTIQAGIAATPAGGTLFVCPGTYVETGQIVINKNLTIIGAGAGSTIVNKAENTGDPGSGNNRGWVLVNASYTLSMSGLTLDGVGKQISIAILNFGTTTVEDCEIKNIDWSAGSYYGRGVCLYSGTANVVRNTVFSNIRRIGVFVFYSGVSALIEGNTYTGKGSGNWLDYGIELGGGATATITGNTITNCDVSTCGWASAGILVTTYYGAGTAATITGNTLTGNEYGIAIGYDANDTSVVTAHSNNIFGNTDGVDTTSSTVTTDARYNWWGDASGPSGSVNDTVTGTPANGSGDSVSAKVRFDPWTGKTEPVSPTTGGTVSFTPDAGAIEGLTAIATPPNPPAVLPYGMFSFNVTGLTPGDTVTINITLPGPPPLGTKWWKYQAGTWYWLPIGSDDGDNIITITLTDGVFPGDADATVNGVIIDPGGPGSAPLATAYGLKISSTEGGSVTKPGEGVRPYLPGEVVSLVASPDAGYKFVNWSGDVDTIADAHNASTTITMCDWYIITANFATG